MIWVSRFMVAGVFACIGFTARADWWTNGLSVTHTGIGYGGNDIASYNADSLTTVFGLDANYSSASGQPAFVGDDYMPNSTEIVRHLRVRWFETGVFRPILSRVHVRVYEGSPLSAGTLIYSQDNPAMIASSGSHLSAFTGNDVYRTSSSTASAALSSQRRLQEVTVRLDGGISLVAGRTYTFAWSLESLSGTEIQCPSLPRRGNGVQEALQGGIRQWRSALGNPANSSSGVDLPFDLFLSTSAAESEVFPATAYTVCGEEVAGTVQDLVLSDDRRMIWLDGPAQICQIQLTGVSPVTSIQRLVFETEVSTLRSGLACEILLFNYRTNRWAAQGFLSPTEDTMLSSEVITSASDYISGIRNVRAQVRWQPINDDEPSQDGWFHMMDRCLWRVIPQ